MEKAWDAQWFERATKDAFGRAMYAAGVRDALEAAGKFAAKHPNHCGVWFSEALPHLAGAQGKKGRKG